MLGYKLYLWHNLLSSNMRLFSDIFTDEEFLSDVFKYEIAFNETIIKAPSAYKSKDQVGNVDVGCGNAFGGNEEEGEQGSEVVPGEEKVLDIQFNGQLVEYLMSKNEFMTYIKGYMKKLKEELTKNNPTRVEGFMKGAQDFVKQMIPKFDEYTV